MLGHKKKERTCRTHRQPTTTLNQYTGKIDSNAFSTTHSRTQREQGDSNAVGLHQQETQTTLRFHITAGRQIHENEFFIQPRIDRSINVLTEEGPLAFVVKNAFTDENARD